jgi:NADH:ubiquinone oxidoreductase subunit E
MSVDKQVEIEICMGSSCFARGNNKTVTILQNFIERESLSGTLMIRGALCKGRCKEGPVIVINGTEYTGLDGAALIDIIKDIYLEKK